MKIYIGPTIVQRYVEAVTAAGATLAETLEEADGYIHTGTAANFPVLPDTIRWVQVTTAGLDGYHAKGLIDESRRWSNATDVYSGNVAESAVAGLLAGLHLLHRSIRMNHWDPTPDTDRDKRFIAGSTVAIIGAGGIGRAAIPLLTALGASVIAVTHSGRPVDGAQATYAIDRIDEAYAQAGHFILAMPLTDETRGMINRAALEKMGPDAWLVNVARGPVVNTDELTEALRDKVIAGAFLDVTDPEPLPDDHDLWTVDNVIITPHVANTASDSPRQLAPVITANLTALMAGERMPTEVTPAKGY